MALNPNSALDRKKIDEATQRSHSDLDFARTTRVTFLKAFQPTDLSRESCEDEILVPALYQAVETDVYDLVAQNPRVTCETEFNHLKAHARRRGLMLNKRIAEVNFAEVLRAAVYDAEFMMGVCEVHNGESHPLDFGDYGRYDPGLPTVGHVPFDDYFYDTTARRYCDRRFDGKYFRAGYQTLLDDPNIDGKTKEALAPLYQNETAWDSGGMRAGTAAMGEGATADLLEPVVNCKTVYLCHEKLVVTLVSDKPDLPPLRVSKWEDDLGPFHPLLLGYMPDQVMGISPVSVLYRLHVTINKAAVKRRDQAATQKNVTAYQGAAKDDAERLKGAKNNESVHVAHIDKLKQFSTMGPDPAVGQYALETQGNFDRYANNLLARAGLGPSSDTVGQDQMILGASSRMQAKKNNSVLAYAAQVLHSLARLLDKDQFYERELFHEMPNKALKIPYSWKPGEREGEPDQYTERIEPYSLMYVNPSAKFNALTAFINGAVPLMPFAAQGMIDMGEYLEMAAEYLDEPRLRDVMKQPQMPPSDPNNFAGDMGVYDVDVPKAGKPNGQYTRVNKRAPGSDSYADKQLQAAMLGQKPQMNGSLPTGVKQL
jgi:hypothetical protein